MASAVVLLRTIDQPGLALKAQEYVDISRLANAAMDRLGQTPSGHQNWAAVSLLRYLRNFDASITLFTGFTT